MTLKTTPRMELFLRTLASGETVRTSREAAGIKEEQTVSNWIRSAMADERPLTENAWTVRLVPGGDPSRFDIAYQQARLLGMMLRKSDLRDELEARLELLRRAGPAHGRPESAATPQEWELAQFTSDPTKPLPLPRPAEPPHPRRYIYDPGTSPRRPVYARTPLTRAGHGRGEPPPGGFSMSRAMGVHQEISRAEARAGKPRLVGYGVKVD